MATNLTSMPDAEFQKLADEIDRHQGLNHVLSWASRRPKSKFHPHIVAEVIIQDEFTHDVVVPFDDIFLVYDTT